MFCPPARNTPLEGGVWKLDVQFPQELRRIRIHEYGYEYEYGYEFKYGYE